MLWLLCLIFWLAGAQQGGSIAAMAKWEIIAVGLISAIVGAVPIKYGTGVRVCFAVAVATVWFGIRLFFVYRAI